MTREEALNNVMDSENDAVKTEDDVIKRQDAIKTVCRTRCGDKAKGCPAHSCPVIEEFDALPSAEAIQGWIPVSERLPEEGQYVLVTSHGRIHLCLADSYGTVTVVMPIISKDATEIVFHPQPDWGDGYAAWMPLPEPYKGGDDE